MVWLHVAMGTQFKRGIDTRLNNNHTVYFAQVSRAISCVFSVCTADFLLCFLFFINRPLIGYKSMHSCTACRRIPDPRVNVPHFSSCTVSLREKVAFDHIPPQETRVQVQVCRQGSFSVLRRVTFFFFLLHQQFHAINVTKRVAFAAPAECRFTVHLIVLYGTPDYHPLFRA